MRRALVTALALACAVAPALRAQPVPQVSAGRIERIASMPSRHVAARHVDVWLPPGYDRSRRYPVLYMHDGQMLFDSTVTWNRQAWDFAGIASRLIAEGAIEPVIVVGIWNSGPTRHSEYFPEKALAFIPEPSRRSLVQSGLSGQPRADAYLRFLVGELKPRIDATYATRPDAASTFVMGSSMGALISLYAISEYPQVFGGAAALSTHWVGAGFANATIPLGILAYLRDHLAHGEEHRLYMDRGTTELDALYAPAQPLAEQVAFDRGYRGRNFMARTYEGAGHNERAWRARLDVPLRFLLAPR
ncbi:MAG: alpha/beta hydrolase-fold protein [Gemmatimonadaceae bacterium]|nr:alpha/beta hydrolase-fold protein [Gemmatimonadaceae bacterium]